MSQKKQLRMDPLEAKKYSFDSIPKLVHPEFNVPIIKLDDDLSQIEVSERLDYSDIDRFNNHTTNPLDNKSANNLRFESDNALKQTTNFSNISPLHKKNSMHTVSFVVNKSNDLEESNIHMQNLSSSHLEFQSDKTYKGTGQNINQNIDQQIIDPKLKNKFLRQGGNGTYNGKRQSRYFTLGETDKTRLTSATSKEDQIIEGTLPLLKNHGSSKLLFQHISKSTKRVLAIAASFVFYEKLRKLTGIRVREVCSKNENTRAEQMRLLNTMTLPKDKKVLKDYLTKKQKVVRKENKGLAHCLQDIPVVHPNSGKLLSWDISIFIFTILNITYIPIESVINTNFQEIYGDKWNYFLWASVSVFIVQIALQTNMGYYDKGQCIMERSRIWKRYFQLGFWLDVLSSFPIFMSVIGMTGYIEIFNLLVLLKVQQVDRFFQKYFEIFTLRRRLYSTAFLKFFYLLLKIIFFGHCFACIFLAMAYHIQEHRTWVTKYGQGLPEAGWFTKYVYAFYWGVTTMTTVGLGDLIPANIYEVVVLSCFMFVSCGTFAYMFNSIGVVLGELNSKHDQFTEEMRLVSRYLSMKNVNHDLQLEVRKYIEYKFDFENEISTEEEHKQCHFLSKNFSEEFLLKLCLSMKNESKLNQELIYAQDEVHSEHLDDIKFYILENGIVRLFVNTSELHKEQEQIFIKNISEWQYFGAVEFFTDEPRHFSAIAVGSTKLLSIKRKQFLALLKQFPADFEKFCMIRDSAKFNRNSSSLKIQCSVCQSFDHCVKYCTNLHFIPDRELSVLKNTFSISQSRQKHFKRNQRMKINSLFEKQVIYDRAKAFNEEESNGENEEEPYSPSPLVPPSFTPYDYQSIPSPTKDQALSNQKSMNLIPELNLTKQESDQIDRSPILPFKLKPKLQDSALVVHSGMRGQVQRGGRQLTIRLQGVEPEKGQINGAGQQMTIPSNNLIEGPQSPLKHRYSNAKNAPNLDGDIPGKKMVSQTQIQIEKVEFSIVDFDKGQIYKIYFENNNLDVVLANHEQAKPFLRKLIEASKSQYFLFPRKFKSNLNLKDSFQAKHDLTFMGDHQ